jgi:hypothetical protein
MKTILTIFFIAWMNLKWNLVILYLKKRKFLKQIGQWIIEGIIGLIIWSGLMYVFIEWGME